MAYCKFYTLLLLPSSVHNLLGRRHGVTNLQLPPSLLHFAVLIDENGGFAKCLIFNILPY